MYSSDQIIPLAQKFLDRVEIKGLQEFYEFSTLVNFFAAMEKGQVEIQNIQELKREEN